MDGTAACASCQSCWAALGLPRLAPSQPPASTPTTTSVQRIRLTGVGHAAKWAFAVLYEPTAPETAEGLAALRHVFGQDALWCVWESQPGSVLPEEQAAARAVVSMITSLFAPTTVTSPGASSASSLFSGDAENRSLRDDGEDDDDDRNLMRMDDMEDEQDGPQSSPVFSVAAVSDSSRTSSAHHAMLSQLTFEDALRVYVLVEAARKAHAADAAPLANVSPAALACLMRALLDRLDSLMDTAASTDVFIVVRSVLAATIALDGDTAPEAWSARHDLRRFMTKVALVLTTDVQRFVCDCGKGRVEELVQLLAGVKCLSEKQLALLAGAGLTRLEGWR